MSGNPAPHGTGGPGFRLVHPLPVAPDVVPTTAMHRLAGWWRQSHGGVCALVGLGGCGKTTAADQFLRATGVLAARAPALGGRLAPAPAGAFLFSLAAAPPDIMFAEMQGWLGAPSSHVTDVLATLAGVARTRTQPLLVVIDALEQIQSTGGAEGVGRLTDARVSELLTRGAYGALPGVALLVTSRLALIDLEIQRLPLQTRIDMDTMDAAAAVALLRLRGAAAGVRSDRELLTIADSYGRHALTIDLASQYHQQHGSLPGASDAGGEVLRSYLELIADQDKALLGLIALLGRRASPSMVRMFAGRLGIEPDAGIQPTVRRLTDIRLLSPRPSPGGEEVFSMHEVVRAAIEQGIEESKRRAWHSAIADGLVDLVAERLRQLDVTERYDLLGMCVAHGAAGQNPMWAAELYWTRIGNFAAAGHRDSQFAWGELACRTLNQHRPPGEVADYLRGDYRGVAGAILSDWALYLRYLGELAPAIAVYRTAYHEANSDSQRTIAAANVAEVSVQRGELREAIRWAELGCGHALAVLESHEGLPTAQAMRGLDENLGRAALAKLYADGADAADAALAELALLHHSAAEAVRAFNASAFVPLGDPPAFANDRFEWGVPRGLILLVRGDAPGALDLATRSLVRWEAEDAKEEITSVAIRSVMVAALLADADTASAVEHLRSMETWARANEARPALAGVLLLAARLARLDDELAVAEEAVAEGLRLARDTGLGLLHIDLLIESAEIALARGEPDDAIYAAATALYGQEELTSGVALYAAPARDDLLAPRSEDWYRASGVFPPPDTGRPALLAATHPECGYRLGEARAREQLGEAMLAGLARTSGRAEVEGNLASGAVRIVARARGQLERAANLLDDVTGGPTAGNRIRERLSDLARGRLTPFESALTLHPPAPGPTRPTARRVMISYTRSDSTFVDALADHLSGIVDDVWVDRRRISIGESFVAAINAALRGITDFVVVLSRDSVASAWVANELNAAVALRNSGAAIAIRPVLLDRVDLPALLADLDAVDASDRDPKPVADRLARALTVTPAG